MTRFVGKIDYICRKYSYKIYKSHGATYMPPKGAFRAKTGPFRTPGGPEGARYQVKVCGEHESNPGGPVRGSRDQIWSLGAPREPQKGHFGPKRALLGPPGAQKGPDTRSKCVVSMSPTQAGQSGAVGTKSVPPGPPEGPKRGISGRNGPF